MIRYALQCGNSHQFESWFQSADAFDTLAARSMIACPDCGSASVTKAVMAPRVRPARAVAPETLPAASGGPDLTAPASPRETALAKLRDHVEQNSDYVGMNFAAEARAMHDGVAPERAIYGEARIDEAKKLLEDGVPVAPLPFMPRAKVN